MEFAREGQGRSGSRAAFPFIVALSLLLLALYYASVFSFTVRNADTVNGFVIGRDMAEGNWRLAGWYFPLDNFWLQDSLIFSILIRIFGSNPILLIYVPAFAWASVVCLAWMLSARTGAASPAGWRIAVIVALFAFPVMRNNPLMDFIAVPSDHVVTIVQAMIEILLADLFLFSGSLNILSIFLVLGTGAIIGDPMFVVIAALPILVAVPMSRGARGSRGLILLAATVATIVLAFVLTRVWAIGGFTTVQSSSTGLVFTALGDLARNATYTLQGLLGFWGADFFGLPARHAVPQALRTPLFALGMTALAAAAWRVADGVVRAKPPPLDFLDAVLVWAVLLLLASTLLSNLMVDPTTARYLLPAVVYAGILVARRAPPFPTRPIVVLLALAGSLLAIDPSRLTLSPELRLRPGIAEVTKWLQENHLGFGYAQYWTASPVTVASRGEIRALPLIRDGGRIGPYLWNVRRDWYPAPLGSQRPFFVIVDGADAPFPERFSREQAASTFGPASETVKVGDYEVDVYR